MAVIGELATEVPDFGINVVVHPQSDLTNHCNVLLWTPTWRKKITCPADITLEEVPDFLEAKFHAAMEDLRKQICNLTFMAIVV